MTVYPDKTMKHQDKMKITVEFPYRKGAASCLNFQETCIMLPTFICSLPLMSSTSGTRLLGYPSNSVSITCVVRLRLLRSHIRAGEMGSTGCCGGQRQRARDQQREAREEPWRWCFMSRRRAAMLLRAGGQDMHGI
ncbi:unnamed protein product [Urochloa humidicola]